MDEYPPVDGGAFIRESDLYRVYVNGERAFAHEARVSARPVNQVWRGYQRPVTQTEAAAFISFDMHEAPEIRVDCNFEVFNAFLRPDSAGINTRRDGDTIYFSLQKPGQYSLDVNGAHNALHIFANPPADAPPENSLYFGHGVHSPGVIEAKSGQVIYIAEGAVVYGAIDATGCEGVRILGRGILDGSRFHRENRQNAIRVQGSRDVTIDGVILRDAPTYALSAMACERLIINNVKVIGQWRYNADGIDLHNTRDTRITNCFVRTFDDCIVLKGRADYQGYGAGGICLEDVLVERCVIWNDWGRALEIGAETMGSYMRNIVFRDCDVLHFLFIACDVQACGDAEVYGVTFEDIRVGEPLDPACEPRLMEIFIRPMCWLTVEKIGRVHDVTFKNISYVGRTSAPCRFIGYDGDSDIQNVKLENVSVNGKRFTAGGAEMSQIIVNGYVSGLTVDGKPVCLELARFEDGNETENSYLIGNGAFIKM